MHSKELFQQTNVNGTLILVNVNEWHKSVLVTH